ncbi:AV1 [Insect-associated begomovirus 4]|nr:AV1 [Insect-associated begomovirus 4]
MSGNELGVGESQRSSRNVWTNGMLFRCQVSACSDFFKIPGVMVQMHYLVYDKDIGTTIPTINDIFDWAHQTNLNSYVVKRTESDRFRIVRKWKTSIISSGTPAFNQQTYKAGTQYGTTMPMNKYFKNLKIFSEFKDVATGSYVSLKSGGLLYVCVNDYASSNTYWATVGGICRVYFNG